MSRFAKLGAAAVATALLVPGLVAADGDDAVGTAAFESVAVTGGAGTITATGVSTFGGEEIEVAADATGDGTVPGSDISTMRLSQDPATGDLVFKMDLADGLPTTGSLPVGVFYEWAVLFPGAGDITLRANFTEYDTPDAEINFDVAVTVDTTFTATTVPGEYDGSTLTWFVQPAVLGAQEGHKLTGAARVAPGLVGFVTFNGVDYDNALVGDFVIGGGARLVVLDAAGETIDETTARVRRGEFTATITDLEPGTYTVEVYAEYGDAAAVETFTVAVS